MIKCAMLCVWGKAWVGVGVRLGAIDTLDVFAYVVHVC